MRASTGGTVLALTRAWRVPEDVLIEAPYTVAVVRTDEGEEVMAVGADEEPSVGDRVLIEEAFVARGDEEAEVWRISALVPSSGASR